MDYKQDDVIYFNNEGEAVNTFNNTLVRNEHVKLKLFNECENDDSMTIKDVSKLRVIIYDDLRNPSFIQNNVLALDGYINRLFGKVVYSNEVKPFLGKVSHRDRYYYLCESVGFMDSLGDEYIIEIKE